MALLARFHTRPGRYDETASVAANLRALVSTRRGYGSFVRDFGLSDIAGKEDWLTTATRLQSELEALIDRYEPRLEDVKVTVHPGGQLGGRLSLSLSASLDARPKVFYISLDARGGGAMVRAEEADSEAGDL